MRIVKWLVVALVVVVAGAFAGWWFFLKSDPEPRAAIKETPVVTGGDSSSAIDGTYTVAPNDTQNFVGYRVTEKLVASVVESDATGRTDDVTGTLSIDGTTVTGVTVTADMRTLTSDNSFRDGRLRSSGIESDKFPEAKFVQTQPATLSGSPTAGTTVTLSMTGDFTLHGVTKPVTIELQGRWDGSVVQVVGNMPIAFSDYGITAPTAPAVASVDDEGEMELQLFFRRA